jgi:hypothetical protein
MKNKFHPEMSRFLLLILLVIFVSVLVDACDKSRLDVQPSLILKGGIMPDLSISVHGMAVKTVSARPVRILIFIPFLLQLQVKCGFPYHRLNCRQTGISGKIQGIKP